MRTCDCRREPQTPLERHALATLSAEPTVTLLQYAYFYGLSTDQVRALAVFLRPHLRPTQIPSPSEARS